MLTKKLPSLMLVIFVTLLALSLRFKAANQLPIDYDEDDYLGAAIQYTDFIRDRDLVDLISYDVNFEHPPLVKLFYALALLPYPEAPPLTAKPASAPIVSALPEPHFRVARLQAALFGTMEVLVLGLLNPLAGLALAINTWQIKYTSQIMLEALPSFTSLLASCCYLKSERKGNVWLLLSSLSLGITAAAKYPYAIVGVAIMVDWLASLGNSSTLDGHLRCRNWLERMLLWGLVSLLVFTLSNPRLWVDPLDRLGQAVQFHWEYANSEHVRQAGFRPWQPLVWLFSSVPWHPGVFLVSVDGFITLVASLGLRRLWAQQRLFAIWLVVALGFLLAWPTKWPQYILILTAPLSLSAAYGFQGVFWEPLIRWVNRLERARQAQDKE